MNYSLEEIVDIDLLQTITDSLYTAFNLPSSLVTLDGKILTESGCQDICTIFHRVNPDSAKECIESDYRLAQKVRKGEKYSITKCPRGLVDCCSPVFINNIHMGNIFIGQYFNEPPTKEIEELFLDQADKYGFSKDEYIKAFKKIPIISEDKQKNMLDVLVEITEMISASGLNKLKELEKVNEVKKNQTNFEKLFLASPDNISITTIKDGILIDVNQHLADSLGYPKEEIIGKNSYELKFWTNEDQRQKFVQKLFNDGSVDNYELEYFNKNNQKKVSLVSARVMNYNGEDVILSIARDITERKKIEQALEESEKRYRIFLESQPDILFRINDKLEFIDCYTNKPDSLLIPIEHIIGQNSKDLLPDFLYELTKTKLEDTLKNNVINTYDYSLEVDNREEWYEARMVPYSSKEALIISRNVTVERKNERALFESEQKFKSIFNNANCGIVILDTNLDIKEVNSQFAKFLNYNPDELINISIRDVSDENDYSNEQTYLNEMLEGKINSYRIHKRYLAKTNNIKWGDLSVSAVRDSNGSIEYFLGIIIDVTEQRKSESKYKNLTENLVGVTYVCKNDESYTMTFLTKNIEILSGYKPEDFISEKVAFSKLIHPDDLKYVRTQVNATLMNHERFKLKYRIITKDNKIKWVEENGLIVIHENGDEHIEGYIYDITEKVETENELIEYRNELESLVEKRTKQLDLINRELHNEIKKTKETESQLKELLLKEKEFSNLKSRFISTASHEFRTPLTTILSSVDLIDLYIQNQKFYEILPYFEKVRRSVTNLTTLIDDVLILNKTEVSQTTYNPSMINLLGITKQIINDIALNKSEEIKLSFETNIDRDINFMLDQKLYSLLCSNLITNAIKYSPGNSEVKIVLNHFDSKINFSVEDNGIGISESDIPLIFEQFHRGENTQNIQGTGLGLSIVKRAVEIQGGQINVKSKLNFGSKFTVILPALRGNDE